MPESTMDDRGRVTIQREFRDRLGDRFVQILTPEGLLLFPARGELPRPPGLDALTASGEADAEAEAGR